MKRYFHITPSWLKNFYPGFTWELPDQEKTIYLTFDDGPIPEVTPYVLNELNKFDVKATFFCVGENVKQYRSVFSDLVVEQHGIGNHTYHHLNGWNTLFEDYIDDVKKCQDVLTDAGVKNDLFRPPHGRIRVQQARKLREKYQVIMWSHLAGDFDPHLNTSKSMAAMKKASSGSVLVFHDSLKAYENLKKLLPGIISFYQDKGFKFKSL